MSEEVRTDFQEAIEKILKEVQADFREYEIEDIIVEDSYDYEGDPIYNVYIVMKHEPKTKELMQGYPKVAALVSEALTPVSEGRILTIWSRFIDEASYEEEE